MRPFILLLMAFSGGLVLAADESLVRVPADLVQGTRQAFAYAQHLPRPGPVILYGTSMGAAAVLKAVADDNLQPAALVLECPFDSLIGTVRHRFTSRGVPSFPFAGLLVFWGGAQEGFNGFRYRPVDSASLVRVPTLLMNGERDAWVRVDEARAIFDALKGPKTLKFFADVGHDPCLRRRPEEWRRAVQAFLGEHVMPAPGTIRQESGLS